MNFKPVLFAIIICLAALFTKAQENKILLSFANGKTDIIKKGDQVRLSYPVSKLQLKNIKTNQNIIGFRGKVDSVSISQIYLRVDKRTAKQVVFNFDDLMAIKKVNKSSELFTFLGTFAVIGSGAALAVNAADISPALTAFAAAFSVFPAAIITANIFYPTKPNHKIGEGYTAKIITIN
ncbi:hypothetical protein A5893_10850 [Pedobacter psychrophilus]|uniref:Uncharacterized protein n=1 Tax=Pedobacter psychrophilus TaxID=1826909 RepID=A0A179DDP5_9SPHI|nr:hypothetical protein [Pedobacter psychrophilus]OAQ39156.1 hypothetical protein A5893_10850 [Pedobacter psychrophilus]